MIDAVGRLAGAVAIPVTADVEGGYGSGTPDDVKETVRRVIGVGAVGINLEDGTGRDTRVLLEAARHAERIAAARAAAEAEGVNLFINARVDTYLRAVGAEDARGRLRPGRDRCADDPPPGRLGQGAA
jgi:2-methylisocitrate lyase-like PEP mutase family enzyme